MSEYSSALSRAIEREKAAYFDDCHNRIQAGETVWMKRHYDSDEFVHLYHQHHHIGYIQKNRDGYDAWVYVYDENRETDAVCLNTAGHVSYEDATAVLLSMLAQDS